MVVSNPRYPPPARDYPNINALNAIRLFFDSTPIETAGGIITPSALLKLNKPVPVGTVPGKSFIMGVTVHVLKATAGAATIDIGTKANPTRFKAAGPLNAVVRDDAAVASGGWIGDTDTPILVTLKGSSDLSGGIFSFLMYYYPKLETEMAEEKQEEQKLGPNATFQPDDENDTNPTQVHGVQFIPGKPVNLEDRLGKEKSKEVLKKLSQNRFFKVDGGTDWKQEMQKKQQAEEQEMKDAEEARKKQQENEERKQRGEAPLPPEDWKGPPEAKLEQDFSGAASNNAPIRFSSTVLHSRRR